MSDKSERNLKGTSPLGNLSGNSTVICSGRCPPSTPNELANSVVILSGRCTSTPKDSAELSPSDLEPGFDLTKESIQSHLNLNRIINNAPIPIFGRRTLQLLNKCINKDPSLQSPEAVESLLPNEKRILTYLTETNENNKFLDEGGECSVESSPSIAYHIRQEMKKLKNKNSKSSNNDPEAYRSIPLKKANYSTSKMKKSYNYKSKLPSFKVSPKTPRAPTLLTAIRAELRLNREKLHKDNNKKAAKVLKFPVSIEWKYHRQRINKDKNKEDAEIKAAEDFTESQVCKPKKQKQNNTKMDNLRKLTVFKAQPIRKYAPLPAIKIRTITVPQSPKIGKRCSKNHNCCSDVT